MLKKIAVSVCAAVLLASVPAFALNPGQPAPALKLPTIGGAEFDLAAYKDKKPVVIAMWQSACGSCVADLQFLSKIAKGNAHAEFIAVNVDMQGGTPEWAAAMGKYLADKAISLNVAADPKFTTGKAFGNSATPATILIGKDGKVVDIIVGFNPGQSEEAVEKKIQALK